MRIEIKIMGKFFLAVLDEDLEAIIGKILRILGSGLMCGCSHL